MSLDFQKICNEVLIAVKHTGEFIRKEYYTFNLQHIEYKGLNNLVSYVDKTAEGMLVEALQKIMPEAAFLTEEETIATTTADYKWIIDPLDGTTNFIHGIPMFSISVALLHKDKAVIGIVYEILRDECFYATAGGKAYMNGNIISASDNKVLKQSLLATGFPYYEFEKMPQYIELLKNLMQNCHGLRRMGSAAIDLAYVACGRFDAFFEYNLNPWDVAGGALIVQQAGGKVTDFGGGDNFIFGREILATNQHIHEELQSRCRNYFYNK